MTETEMLVDAGARPAPSIPTIGAIDLRRRVLGVTQDALCRAADVSPHSYSRAKSGRVRSLADTLAKLGRALDSLESRVAP